MSNRLATDTWMKRCSNTNALGACMYVGPCLECANNRVRGKQAEETRLAKAKAAGGGRVRSKCINCNKQRACLKIEMRAPLPESVLVYDEKHNCHHYVDYETHGPMLEVCRACAADPIIQRTIITTLLEGL